MNDNIIVSVVLGCQVVKFAACQGRLTRCQEKRGSRDLIVGSIILRDEVVSCQVVSVQGIW